MKKTILLLLVFSSVIVCAQVDKIEATEKLAQDAARYLKQSNFEKLHSMFSKKMAAALPIKQMDKSFSSLFKQFGALEEIKEFNIKHTAEADYFQQAVVFEKGTFYLVFTLDEKNKLTSFNLRPYQPSYEWTAPEYANGPIQFSQKEITVGDSLKLNGKMTVSDSGMETIVVFVHGSGPNDMDESLGPNKLFKDIAFGLAANGIASIRYNKRTYDYPSAMASQANSLTIQQVVIDDAVNAIQLARKSGAKKVILLGHSLGGHCAPMIAALANPDAVIVLAGNVSPLEDVLVPQFEYIKKNDSSTTINDLQMAMIRTQVERVQNNDYNAETAPPLLPMGLPASFWLSLKDYAPQKVAKKQTQPYLILNGERDYQVTPREAKKWKNGSKNSLSRTFIYPKLNHLFFEGEGICLPSEYEREAHFSATVLNDIIDWISEI